MIAAGFIPDVRLFPVSGFLHRLAAAWAADIAVVIVITALSVAARVQHFSARYILQAQDLVAIKPQALAMTASINGDVLIAHLFHTMVTLRASQAV